VIVARSSFPLVFILDAFFLPPTSPHAPGNLWTPAPSPTVFVFSMAFRLGDHMFLEGEIALFNKGDLPAEKDLDLESLLRNQPPPPILGANPTRSLSRLTRPRAVSLTCFQKAETKPRTDH